MADKWEQVRMCQVLQASGCSSVVSADIDEGDEAPPRVPVERNIMLFARATQDDNLQGKQKELNTCPCL